MKRTLLLCLGALLLGVFTETGYCSRALELTDFGGELVIHEPEKGAEVSAEKGMDIGNGFRLVTKKDGYAVLSFPDEQANLIKINNKSDVIVKIENGWGVELLDGEVVASLSDLGGAKDFKVRTPCAVCGVRGTSWSTSTDKKATEVAVADGEVYVRGFKKDGTAMREIFPVEKGFMRRIERFERPGRMTKMTEKAMVHLRQKVEIRRVAAVNRGTDVLKEDPGETPVPAGSAVSPDRKGRAEDPLSKAEPGAKILDEVERLTPEKMSEKQKGMQEKMEKRTRLQEKALKRAEKKDNMIKKLDRRSRMDRVMQRRDIMERRIDRRESIEERQIEGTVDEKNLILIRERSLDSFEKKE